MLTWRSDSPWAGLGTEDSAMRALLASTLLAMTFLPQQALAADWRYCLAPSHAEHKIYMSPPFPATESMNDVESQFGRTLAASGLHFDDVQCPRGDGETAALTMQQHAIMINRELGNEIINLSWKPGG
jgi:hypothetical protein